MSSLLPEIPSDNLYKFSTFFGLLIIISATIYPLDKYNEYKSEELKFDFECRKIEYELLVVNKGLNEVSEELGNVKKDFRKNNKILNRLKTQIHNGAKNANYRVQQKFLSEYYPEIADNHVASEIIPTARLEEKNNKLSAINKSQGILNIELHYKKRMIDELNFQISLIFLAACIFLLLGGVLMVLGLRFWYLKIQQPSDAILKRDAL